MVIKKVGVGMTILEEAKRLLEKLDSDKDVHWFEMVRALRGLVEYVEKFQKDWDYAVDRCYAIKETKDE